MESDRVIIVPKFKTNSDIEYYILNLEGTLDSMGFKFIETKE